MSLQPVLDPFLLALAGIALAALGWAAAWRHREVRLSRRVLLGLLRTAGVAVFLFLLLGPTRKVVETPPGQRPRVALAVDRSGSMAVADVEGRARYAAALDAAARVAEELGEEVGVETWFFAGEAAGGSLDAPPEAADGSTTDLGRALESVLAADPATAPAAVVLFSDGIQIAPRDPLETTGLLRARRSVLHAVCFGGEVIPPDVSLHTPRTRLVGFAGQRFRVPLTVRTRAVGARELRVTLGAARDGEGRAAGADRERLVAVPADGEATVHFDLAHEAGGFYRHRAEVATAAGEYDRANNSLAVGLTVLDGSIDVLLLEGAPHWDSKFFAQYAHRDPHVRLTSIVRLREGKCFRVDEWAGEAAPPRRGTLDQEEIPRGLEAYGAYDVIVLGKALDSLLDGPDALALQRFVKERGGAVFFLRGRGYNSFFPELAALEPVVWDERPAARSFRTELTEIGRALGAFHFGLDEPVATSLQALPRLEYGASVERTRAFVDVHADAPLPGGQRAPVLLSRRYGKGMVLMLNCEGTWRWGFPPLAKKRYAEAYAQFFGGLLRWLATQSDFLPGRDFLFRSSRPVCAPGEPVVFTVASRLEPAALREYRPRILLRRDAAPGGGPAPAARQVAPAPAGEPGVWTAAASLAEPGLYTAVLENNVGRPERLSVPLGVRPRRGERTVLSADAELLRRLARAADGRLLAAEEVAAVIRTDLAARRTRLREAFTRVEPAWDGWLLGLVLAGLWFADWTVRRREGLA